MAKDPKNFTGENVPALLAEYDRHQRAKDDRSMLGHAGLLLVAIAVFVLGIIALVASWLR